MFSIDGSGSRRASIGSILRSSIFSEDGGIEGLSCASITSFLSFSTSPCPVLFGFDRRATIEYGGLDSEADPGFGDKTCCQGKPNDNSASSTKILRT
jgi:hypothetical protein